MQTLMERFKKLPLLGKLGLSGTGFICFCCSCAILIPSPPPRNNETSSVNNSSVLATQTEEESAIALEPTIKTNKSESTNSAEVQPTEMLPTQTTQPTKTPTLAPTNLPPTQAPTFTPSFPQVKATSGGNLRAGPGTNYDVLGQANSGQIYVVVAIDPNGDWYNILLPTGGRAWIGGSIVTKVDSSAFTSLKPAETIPAPPTQQATKQPTLAPTLTATQPPVAGNPGSGSEGGGGGGNEGGQSGPPAGVIASCTCAPPDLDCGDFATHNSAQACYNYCMQQVGYDVYGLDGNDNDGLACESRP